MDLRSQLTILFCSGCKRCLFPGAKFSDGFSDTEELCHACIKSSNPRLTLEQDKQ